MKPGLLLKKAPELIIRAMCHNCPAVFSTAFEFQQHMKIKHNQVYAYEVYHYEHTPKVYYYARWIDIKDYKGTFIAPWKTVLRPFKRYKVTKEELDNRNSGKCHCGKPKSEWEKCRRKYCGGDCADDWYSKIINVGQHRFAFLDNHKKCESCGKRGKETIRNYYGLEMDHIIAIILGGHPWDERNLQALCPECHRKKTKSDVKILAWWRRESNYEHR